MKSAWMLSAILIAIGCGSALNANAQSQDGFTASDDVTATAKPTSPPVTPSGVKVPSWKELGEARQDKLRRFEKHWDAMPASRRVMLLERLEHYQQLSPEQQRRYRNAADNYRGLPPPLRRTLRLSLHHVRTLPIERQRAIRAQWQSMSAQQRRQWLEAGGPGFVAPPKE